MPSALYRPLEQSLKEYNDDYHDYPHGSMSSNAANATATYVPLAASSGSALASRHIRNGGSCRRYLILALISLIFIYFLWCSLTTISGADGGNTDNNEVEEHSTGKLKKDYNKMQLQRQLQLFIQRPELFVEQNVRRANTKDTLTAALAPAIYKMIPRFKRKEKNSNQNEPSSPIYNNLYNSNNGTAQNAKQIYSARLDSRPFLVGPKGGASE